MRAHTPHPWAPIPEKTACQKTCRLSHSPKVTEVPTGGLGVFGACGPPNAGAPPIRTQSRPESLAAPSDETRPKGGPWCAAERRAHSTRRAHIVRTIWGLSSAWAGVCLISQPKSTGRSVPPEAPKRPWYHWFWVMGAGPGVYTKHPFSRGAWRPPRPQHCERLLHASGRRNVHACILHSTRKFGL